MLSVLQKICVGFAAVALAFGQTPANGQFTAAYQALAKKDYDSAIVFFRRGLKQQPANSQGLKDLAYTLIKTGESAAAREEFRIALNLNKNDEQAALEYAFLANETGEQDEARRVFQILCRSGSGATRKTAANALINIGKESAVQSPAQAISEDSIAPAPPIRSGNLWVFFDSAYRMRADVDYLAKRWSDDGISLLFVATWHNMERDPLADEYLSRLITACHEHAIAVYAWLELPFVSEQFWTDHPEWREKNGLDRDAQVGWRKLMNLQNPDCSRAAGVLVSDLLNRFDWDGVNLAELSFESTTGTSNPAGFTPMNDNVRSEFKELADFDPLLLFDPASPHNGEKDRATFLQFRTVVETRLQSEWLNNLKAIQKTKPYLDVVMTARNEESALIVETPGKQKIALDLSAVGLSQPQLRDAAASASKQHLTVAIYSENAIGRADLRSLAEAAAFRSPGTDLPAHITAFRAEIQSATVLNTELDIAYQSRSRASITFDESVTAIEVDGAPFWKASGNRCSGWAMLPAGQHLATFMRR